MEYLSGLDQVNSKKNNRVNHASKLQSNKTNVLENDMLSHQCDNYLRSTILRGKLLNRPLYHVKNLPIMAGALHHLKTPSFLISKQFLHFRTDSQIFHTGFSRLFPLSIFLPITHRSRSALPPDPPCRSKIRARLALEKPVEEAACLRQDLGGDRIIMRTIPG